MTDETKEALKLALEALDGLYLPGELERVNTAITAIREALAEESSGTEQTAPKWQGVRFDSALHDQPAQPQQEPVAYIHRQGNHWEVSERILLDDEKARGWTEEPLYTSPPAQRKPWVGLTNKEIEFLCYANLALRQRTATEMAFAVEAKLKEKNA